MQTTTIIVLVMIMLAYARTRSPGKTRHTWLQQLGGWQRIFGTVAIILALLIVLNPEFFALGLLGDTAFFDMLALALALQMHLFAVRAIRLGLNAGSKCVRSLGIPSLGTRYLAAISMDLLASAGSTFQKAVSRSLSRM